MDDIALLTPLIALLCLISSGAVNGGLNDDYPSSGEAPYIIEQPSDVTVARHQPATLNCRAGGSPTPTIKWYKGGVLVVADTHRSLLPAGDLFFLRATHGRAHSDAGVYWCEATNRYGTARSRNTTLHVAVLRDEFRLEPASTKTAQGETIILECSPPKGSPEPSVYWKKNGQILQFDGDSRMHLVDGGSLEIQDARQTDAGRYQCIARNAAGTRESSIATLKIHIKPYLITGPEDVVAQTGSSVTFQCRVGGDPLPDVLWRRTAGEGNMPLKRVKVLDDWSLRLNNVILADEGEYSCEAENSVGSVTATGYLTVYDPPSIKLKPSTINAESGTSATFTCSATGRPFPTIFWSIEGNRTIILPGTSKGKYYASPVIDGNTILTINDTNKNDRNMIVCSAVNFAGSAFVRGKLTVTSDDDRPPPIITNGPSNQTLPIKSMAVFPCTAIGTPEPIIAWYFEGEALIQNHRRNVSNDGTLILRDLDKSDSGVYTCVASSPHGKYVWSGTLIADTPTNPNIHFFRAPDITTLPGPPTKPLVYNVTQSSVTLTWNQNNKIGSSSIVGYQVEVFAKETLSGNNTPRNSRGWIVLHRNVHSTQYVANSLVPGVTYMFIVRAENSHGLSAPSPVSEAITIGDDSSIWDAGVYSNNTEFRNNIMTDNIVELIEATPIDSRTIKLMWEILNFYNFEGLFIYYRPLDNSTTEYEMKTILHSNDVSGYEITSLRKYTKYEFFLVPFYKKFEGKPSNSREVQTLDDVPDGPPTNIEMFIYNTSTVHLKWSPPEPHLQNGAIIGYNVVMNWLDIPANKSMVAINTTVQQATNLIMTNLTSGVSYSVQIAAETIVGAGPFSPKVYLNIDSHSVGLDPLSRYPINGDVSIVAGDFVMETWFYFLIGAIILFKIIVIGGILYIRKHNIFAKKSALPNIYDSNGTSLVTQMNIKAAVSLSHPLSSCYNKNTVTKTESLLWMENQPGLCMSNTQKTHQNKEKVMSEYDKVAQQLPEYAEVTSARVNANEWNTSKTATSPAAYASVTLVANTRQCVSSLGWFPPGKNVDSMNYENRYPPDEELYPASNGGYYNRNVYSEKYFQGHPNVLKFYDLPLMDKAQKAQIRYNQSLEEKKVEKNAKTEASQSLIGRTYGINSRKNSETEMTYKAFGGDDSDEDNYAEDAGYDDLQAMQTQRPRPQHQYERPSFDNDNTRTMSRFTSFRHGQSQGNKGSSQTSLGPSVPPPAPQPRVDSINR